VPTSGGFRDVALGSLPFAAVMLGVIFLLLAFPELATWLPKTYNALK